MSQNNMQALLQEGTRLLQKAGIEEARLESRLFWKRQPAFPEKRCCYKNRRLFCLKWRRNFSLILKEG